MLSPECRFLDFMEQFYQNPIAASCTWRQSGKARSLEGLMKERKKCRILRLLENFSSCYVSMWQKEMSKHWALLKLFASSIDFFLFVPSGVSDTEFMFHSQFSGLQCVYRGVLVIVFPIKQRVLLPSSLYRTTTRKSALEGIFSGFHCFCGKFSWKIFPASFRLEKDLNDINCSRTASTRRIRSLVKEAEREALTNIIN